MNYRMIGKSIGNLLLVEAACMLPSLLISLIYPESDATAFAAAIALTTAAGFLLSRLKSNAGGLYARDGFAIVALGWILLSAFGALPFLLSGAIPRVEDALFESISGFTTTGASILREVESLPRGILFWRSFTHWMGGMGVLVMMIAIMPSVKANTIHILKAESPGPTPGKLVPKVSQTAKILYLIYILLTATQVVFLVAGGMPLYDSLVHSFSTAGTGGFSSRNLSVAAYGSDYIEIVITVFMFLFGVNFTLYYTAFKGGLKNALHDEELRVYFFTVVGAAALIAINVYSQVYGSVGESVQHAAFQVSSLITTTGFATADFNLWPVLSQLILLLIMFIGASAGSTGGGIKVVRVVVLFKVIKRELTRVIHPRAVRTIKLNGRLVDEEVVSGVMAFFYFYILIFVAAVLTVALEGEDIVTTVTSVIATLNNVGPGLGRVGPMGNFADLSVLSKAVLSLCMLIGRLEIYPIMLLMFPSFWKRGSI